MQRSSEGLSFYSGVHISICLEGQGGTLLLNRRGSRGWGRTPPPFHRQNIGKKEKDGTKKKCTKLQENASKIANVPRGHAFRPPGAHTCDVRTASLSPTPHAPPFPKSWIRPWMSHTPDAGLAGIFLGGGGNRPSEH